MLRKSLKYVRSLVKDPVIHTSDRGNFEAAFKKNMTRWRVLE